jgi:hypothetical protein
VATSTPSDQAQVGDVVRELNPATGWMRTTAGIGLPGFIGYRPGSGLPNGIGGPAATAALTNPCQLVGDHHSNLVVVGSPLGGSSIMVIARRSGFFYGQRMRVGYLYAVPEITNGVAGVAVDYAGNLVVTVPGHPCGPDGCQNAAIQVLAETSGTFYGQRMNAGHVYQIAELGSYTIGGVTADAAGNPVVDEGSMVVIAARSGTFDGRRMRAGHRYQLTSGVSGPAVTDRHGNLVIVTPGQLLYVRANQSGVFYGRAMRAGHVYQISRHGRRCVGSDCAISAAAFGYIAGVTTDQNGNLLLADSGYRRIWAVAARTGRYYGLRMRALRVYAVAGNGSAYSDSGDGGSAARAELGWYVYDPYGYEHPFEFFGVACDPVSGIYLSDAPDNLIRMIPLQSGTFFGQRMRAGDIYTIAGTGVRGNPRDGEQATRTEISLPYGLTVDRSGNLLFVDGQATIEVVAARAGTFYGLRMRADHLYRIAGGGTPPLPVDGTPATAAFIIPEDVKIDGHGNVLYTDFLNDGVWAMPARGGTYYGLRMTAGDIYQVAGGGTDAANGIPAVGASVNDAHGIALDSAGNILIANGYYKKVQVVAVRTGQFYGQPMTAGDIYTIAGGGTHRGSGYLATDSRLALPLGLAVDRVGNVIVSISGLRKLLQVIATRSGTFYGQNMTAGHLYTIAGGGHGVIPGNRLGTQISLRNPEGVAVEPSGSIVLAELEAGRLLLIHP